MVNTIQISKRLSYVLRHSPESIGITLDPNGWVLVSELLTKLGTHGMNIDRVTLERVVAENDKKRFTFDEGHDRIRAAQGHSIDIDLKLSPVDPPAVLYHGTAERFWTSIDEKGLIKQNRQYVHLSSDERTAVKVGQRHGKPIVLRIDTQKMVADGLVFFKSDNNVWLTDSVPRQYIERT